MSVPEREVKKLKDFTDEVKTSLPELTALATHQFDEALNQMLALEKKTRLAADSLNSVKVATTILDTCVQHQRWQALNDHISILCKRRAQLQRVYESVVQTAYTYVAKTPDDATKRALIDCLRTVSAGKIFVELERARLTKQLAEMEESEGRTAAAADILLEVQVETIGTMEAREKIEFLLEQVRLCLAKRDYVRTDIIAKKVDTKVLKKDEMSDLRVRFYKLIIQYHNHFGNYLAIANAYREIFYTPSILADPALWKDALIGVVVYAILSPFDSETSDLLHRIQQEKKLSALPAFANMLNEFLGDELMQWPLVDEKVWRDHSIFSADLAADGTPLVTVSSSASASSATSTSSSTAMVVDSSSSSSSSSSSALDAEKIIVHDRVQRWKDLHKRVVQHNIRVIAKYYSRITLKRLSSLLCVSDGDDAAELFLSEMVTSKQLYAKIDRHVGIIQFTPPQQSELVLLEFTNDVERLLALVDQTTHLISKENMVHKIRT